MLIGRLQAMRELSALSGSGSELDLCATAALLSIHESAKVVDHDAVMELQGKLEVWQAICWGLLVEMRGRADMML